MDARNATSSGRRVAPSAAPQLALVPPPPEPAGHAARIEGILFVADAPVAVADLARALEVPASAVELALRELAIVYGAGRGLRLQRADGHVQLVSAPEVAGSVTRFLGLEQTVRLSRAALETLSIVAYRQPVTRPEIEALRGVDSDGALRSLLARGLVEARGRRPTVGHPVEFGTTFQFLEYFGLSGLEDLPAVASVAPRAEDPAVEAAADPGPDSAADADAAAAADPGPDSATEAEPRREPVIDAPRGPAPLSAEPADPVPEPE